MATRRGRMRDELIRAIQNISMCATHLMRFYEAYKVQHPEVAGYVGEILDALLIISENIQKIHDSI